MRVPLQRVAQSVRISCPFCWEWVEPPAQLQDSYSGDCVGGRCDCGAVYVVDETGKAGGQALMDSMTLACDGDVQRALDMESGKDYQVQTKPYQAEGNSLARLRGHAYMQPQVWFLKRS